VRTPAKADEDARPLGVIIDPNGLFTVERLRVMLGLRKNSLKREIRLGRLQARIRLGRYFILGSWIKAWIESGEVPKSQRNAAETGRARAANNGRR
jgi:hypothetical protein